MLYGLSQSKDGKAVLEQASDWTKKMKTLLGI
jgi:hypothetical protein